MARSRAKDLRVKAKLRQVDVGQAIGVSSVVVSNLETDKFEPSVNRWWTLADLYQVSLDYMFHRVDNPYPDGTVRYRWFPVTQLQISQIASNVIRVKKESERRQMYKITRMVDIRKGKHMTQADMAKKLDTSTSNYGRYEVGIREPDIATLIKIADVLNVSLDYLVGRSDTPEYVPVQPSNEALEFIDTIPPAAPQVVSVEFPWMPKTETEFRAYVLKMVNGGEKNDPQ